MRYEMRYFKIGLCSILSCLCTKLTEKNENFAIKKLSKDITFRLQKLEKSPLLQEKFLQPILSIERYVSDSIGGLLRKFKKFLKMVRCSKTRFSEINEFFSEKACLER